MECLYDDLENYEEKNIIEDLKNENTELKEKLEQYSSTVNQLQIDFDNLNSEYKKLELNYSSLLKTAKAEIQRKTNMITQLNMEKDMMVIQAFKGKQSFYNKATKPNIESRPIKEPTLGHVGAIDTKENIFQNKGKTTAEKSNAVLSQFKKKYDEAPIPPKEQRRRDDEETHLYHNGSATKSDHEIHRKYTSRQRDKSRHRWKSPKRASRHRSRSPPSDRLLRRKSREKRSAHRDPERSVAKTDAKHKALPQSEEPSLKRVRVDSYGTYPNCEKGFAEGASSPKDALRSCQSPDYMHYDIDQSLTKEIIHTAATPQDDPRTTSKKYIVLQTESGKEVLKSVSSSTVSIRPLPWARPRVIMPDALLHKPPSVRCDADMPLTNSDRRSSSANSRSESSKQHIPFIDDLEAVLESRDIVSIEVVEGDLLLSDEASNNADPTLSSDQLVDHATRGNRPESIQSEVTDQAEEFPNHVEASQRKKEDRIANKAIDISVERSNHFESVAKEKCGADGVIQPKDKDRQNESNVRNANTISLDRSESLGQLQEPKRKQCPDKSSDKQRERTHKKHKRKSTDTKPKATPAAEQSAVRPDSNRKFGDLFGDSSNSLITPEDLGIKSREAVASLTTKLASICDDTQSAVDIRVGHVEVSRKESLFENMTPASSADRAHVVVISTGVQSKLCDQGVGVDALPPLAALATSTPLKDQPRSGDDVDVPDVRIFVKRRRKIKKI